MLDQNGTVEKNALGMTMTLNRTCHLDADDNDKAMGLPCRRVNHYPSGLDLNPAIRLLDLEKVMITREKVLLKES